MRNRSQRLPVSTGAVTRTGRSAGSAARRGVFPAMLLAAVFGAGCTGGDPLQTNLEYLPEMIDSVPYDSFSPNPNTRDGKTLIAPAKGSVPRGFAPLHYGPGPDEAARAGRELQSPVPDMPEAIARGKVLFKRFCTPCHGAAGAGDGPIVPAFPTPPPLTAEHARKMPDGQMFHVIGYGQGLMPAHGAQVAQADRWALVRYIRSLQTPAVGGTQSP